MGTKLAEIVELRYGENPNQWGRFLADPERLAKDPLAVGNFELIQGDNPGYINVTDLDRSLSSLTRIGAAFDRRDGSTPNLAIGVKHGNACGAAFGPDQSEVTRKMLAGNPISIFGGILMLNYAVNKEVADEIFYQDTEVRRFIDTVIAPSVDDNALTPFTAPNGRQVRIIVNPALLGLSGASLDSEPQERAVRGGKLIQQSSPDVLDFASEDLTTHGETRLSEEQERWLMLAWGVGATSNSNTINLVKDDMLIANGVSQQDRVGAAKLAVAIARKTGHKVWGSVAYSDSFFPKPDGSQVLTNWGVHGILATEAGKEFETVKTSIVDQNVAFYTRPDSVGRGFSNH